MCHLHDECPLCLTGSFLKLCIDKIPFVFCAVEVVSERFPLQCTCRSIHAAVIFVFFPEWDAGSRLEGERCNVPFIFRL